MTGTARTPCAFSLLRLASKGQDIRFSEDRIPESRNFANKLWNAARFVQMNIEGLGSFSPQTWGAGGAALPERWILSCLQRTIEKVNNSLSTYDFDEACAALYSFVWNDFCDWFLELSKPALQGTDAGAKLSAQATLLTVLETTLRLLHPIMPFVTEEIWQALPHDGASICLAPFPQADALLIDEDAERGMALVIDSIGALRSLRADFTPGGPENEAARAAILARRFTVTVVPDSEQTASVLREQLPSLVNMARLGDVSVADAPPAGVRTVPVGVAGATLYVPAAELLEGVDPQKEAVRLGVEIAKLDKELASVNGRLSNPGFVSKAAPEAIEKARTDAEGLAARRDKLDARRALLSE